MASTELASDEVRGPGGSAGFVATMSNATGGNAVLVFPRAVDGSLGGPVAYPTGGNGSGGGLGNQSGLVGDAAGRIVYAVNAGSNSISVLQVNGTALVSRQVIGSGGTQPISLALSGRLLYVLNDGAPASNITGFRVRTDGTLEPLAGSTRSLSVPVPDAAQIGFDRSGRRLIVTEKATNNIVTFTLDPAGRPGSQQIVASNGGTPFGFAVDPRANLIVSEAFGGAPGASAASSYRFEAGSLGLVDGSVPTTQTAACWVAISGDGRFAYTTNTGSATITGYAIAGNGHLNRLAADGVTGTTDAGPIDLASRPGSPWLYSLNGRARSISGFRIRPDGGLDPLGTTTGLPSGANGLVMF